jgi:hypothetical protein
MPYHPLPNIRHWIALRYMALQSYSNPRRVHLRLALNLFTGSTNDGDIDLSGFQAWLAANGTF